MYTRIHPREILDHRGVSEPERAAHRWYYHGSHVALATGFVSQGSYSGMDGLSFMFRS